MTHQAQKHCECIALPFPLGLSAHRPLSFSRRLPNKHRCELALPPLPIAGVENSLYAARVERIFNARMQDKRDPKEFETLAVLKIAMRAAANELANLPKHREAFTIEEKLSSVFGFLHAVEQCDIRKQTKYTDRYPYIKSVINPHSHTSWAMRACRFSEIMP